MPVVVASRWLPGSVRVVRGARAWLPESLINASAVQRVSVQPALPARDTSSRLVEPRSSIKCWGKGQQSSGSVPASYLRRLVTYLFLAPSCRPKVALAIAPLHRRRHDGPAVVRRKPFVQGRTRLKRVVGTMRGAHTHFSRLWGLSSNKSLQRSGTHKVPARGRALTLWAGAVRPRATAGRRAAAELSR